MRGALFRRIRVDQRALGSRDCPAHPRLPATIDAETACRRRNRFPENLIRVELRTFRCGYPDSPRLFDEREVRLLDFGREPGTAFTYLYDFGDDWRHHVEIEQHLALDLLPNVATCTGGARARSPEDVGGVPGYERFLEVMADRDDPEHADMKRWCGGHFDPDWFDPAMADKDVRAALRPNVRRRMHQPKPKRPVRPA